MKLRLIGDRVLVRPVLPAEDDVVTLTDADRSVAEVVDVGECVCGECGAPLDPSPDIGTHVLLRPGAPYHEVREAGDLIGWIVARADVIAEVT